MAEDLICKHCGEKITTHKMALHIRDGHTSTVWCEGYEFMGYLAEREGEPCFGLCEGAHE